MQVLMRLVLPRITEASLSTTKLNGALSLYAGAHICDHCFFHFHGHYILPYTGEGDQGTAETEVYKMGHLKTENN